MFTNGKYESAESLQTKHRFLHWLRGQMADHPCADLVSFHRLQNLAQNSKLKPIRRCSSSFPLKENSSFICAIVLHIDALPVPPDSRSIITPLSGNSALFSIMSRSFLNVNNVKKPLKVSISRHFQGLSNYSQMLNREGSLNYNSVCFFAA